MSRRRLITAEEFEAMSPGERAALVNERIVTDLDELPPEFRRRVSDTGLRLATERGKTTG